MKTSNLFKVFLMIMMIGILLSSGTASSSVIDQNRPDVIYRERNQFYSNDLVKGNTSESRLDLLINSVNRAGERTTIRGDVNVSQVENTISVNGTGSANIIRSRLNIISGIQFDDYLPNAPVGERFKFRPIFGSDTRSATITIDRTFTTDFSYSSLQENENFREVVRSDIDATAFVHRSGVIGSTQINDSDGNALATVIGFRTQLRIVIYQTSTEKLIGLYSGSTGGYGNIFPTRAISYLSNQSYVREVGQGVNGYDQLQGQDRVSWYYVGYNDTYNLDLYRASFRMMHQSQAVLFTPQNGQSTLGLSSVSLGLESFLNDLEQENELQIDENSAEQYDDMVVSDVIEEETSVKDPVSSDVSLNLSSTMIFGGQIIALVLMGKVLLRKFYN